jgi:hypothetical protein
MHFFSEQFGKKEMLCHYFFATLLYNVPSGKSKKTKRARY